MAIKKKTAKKSKKIELIVYRSPSESLICVKSKEKDMLKRYFSNTGRQVDNYDRYIICGVVQIESTHTVTGDYTEFG